MWDSEEGSYLRLRDIVSLNSRLESNKEEEKEVLGESCPELINSAICSSWRGVWGLEFGVWGLGVGVRG